MAVPYFVSYLSLFSFNFVTVDGVVMVAVSLHEVGLRFAVLLSLFFNKAHNNLKVIDMGLFQVFNNDIHRFLWILNFED
jgi:hypothetical protein